MLSRPDLRIQGGHDRCFRTYAVAAILNWSKIAGHAVVQQAVVAVNPTQTPVRLLPSSVRPRSGGEASYDGARSLFTVSNSTALSEV